MTLSRILLVDDEDDIRTIGEMSLSMVGQWDVLTAGDGPTAVEIALREQPDLILLDVMMPGMDGPTTFGKLRETPRTATIPVVFITAKVQKQEVERYMSLGALGVIAKPFDPMTLPDQIRALIDG